MLFPVLILFWIGLSPKGTIPGIQHLSYLVIFALASLASLLKQRDLPVTPYGLIITLVFLIWWLALLISFTINMGEIRLGAFFEAGRPVLFASLFLCGYSSLKENGSRQWQKILVRVSKILILVILLVSIVQLFYVDFFSLIWSSDKTRGLGSLVRVTGTMYNPNSMAFFVSFLCFGIVALQKIRGSLFWIMVTLVLVVLASSRTLMLAFPAGLATIHWLQNSKKSALIGSFKMAGLFLVFFGVMLGGIYLFADHLPYASQLFMLLSTDTSAADVHSFSTRQMQWATKIDLWLSGGVTSVLFGAGSVPQLQVGDNDLIYVATRLGVFGVVTHILIYILLFILSWKSRWSYAGIWLCSIMTMVTISGITLESLGGWQPPIYLFLVAGAAYATMDARESMVQKTQKTLQPA